MYQLGKADRKERFEITVNTKERTGEAKQLEKQYLIVTNKLFLRG